MSRINRLITILMAGLLAVLAGLAPAQAQEAVLPGAPDHTRPPLTNPACASWEPNRVDCFIIGNDGQMYHTYSDQASSGDHRHFSRWIQEPSAPLDGFDRGAGIGVTAWGPGRLDIMAITPDGDVVHTYYDQNAWQLPDWEFVAYPGNVGVNEIGCTSWGVNRIDCFTRGKNHRVYQVRWDGASWGTFDLGPLPTGTYGDNSYLGMAAAGYAPNALFLVLIAIDGNVWQRKWDGASWSAWANGGKPSGDNLMTVSCLAGVIYLMDCVFSDVAGRIWHRSYYDGAASWLDWHNLDAVGGGINAYYASGVGTSKVVGDQGALYALTYGVDGRLYLGFGRGGAASFNWYGWDSLGRPADQRQLLPLILVR